VGCAVQCSAVLCCAVPCCDALFRDGWDRDKEVAGDDMVVVPPQNWLITSIILGDYNLLCSSKIEN
jgi:hypothetical protein